MIDSIRNFFYPVKRFFSTIKNLLRWFPVIYRDRDWDDSYIFEILQFKLKNQADYISKRDFYEGAQIDARNMRICVNLIEKIKEGTYESEHMDYHVSNYNFVDVENKPDLKRLEIEQVSENFDDYFKKYKHAYKVVTSKDSYIFDNDTKNKIAMNISHYNHNKARKLLFKIMESQIERWWE